MSWFDFCIGIGVGVLMTFVLAVLIGALVHADAEIRCMSEHNAPACVQDQSWHPVYRREVP